MHKYFFIGVLLFSMSASAIAINSVIVLSYGNLESIEEDQLTYQLLNVTINAQTRIKPMHTQYILEVGPYPSNEMLALSYMILKGTFPHAVIIEEEPKKSTKIKVASVIEATSTEEKTDNSVWVALFTLAIVGILFMFLSSNQIKRLKLEHSKIKSRHQQLEARQHEVLSSMGENIHNIAKESINHTSIIAEKVKNTPLHKVMTKVISTENELLDMTDDLIKFLRLKSKKVHIQNEVFNFNHVLNEVAGLLHYTYKQNDTELIFNIDKNVPKNMKADSLHLGQVLTNILEYLIQHNQSHEIILEVTMMSSFKEGLALRCYINTDMMIENKAHLFDSYYDDVSRKYVGLGLFVAQELTHLMDGELIVIDRDDGGNSLRLSIPIKEKSDEKRKYRLPNKGLVGKKVLLVDKSPSAALATKKLFEYFKAEVKIVSAKNFTHYGVNFSEYDIVALSNSLFSFKDISLLTKLKKNKV
ncbi:MAG: hypothetical protein Q9M36_14900 [Sulfurovum sp.]|nr:hypothetical protein [Sulfurovum sp.]